MHHYEELIHELAGLCGIVPEYWDSFGTQHIASIETKKAILKAMGMDLDSAEGIEHEIRELRKRPWNRVVEPVIAISVNQQPFELPLYLPLNEGEEQKLTISWSVEDEERNRQDFSLSGDAISITDQQWIDGTRYVKIPLKDKGQREIGYYFVTITCEHPERIFPEEKHSLQKKSRVIIAPDQCYIPPPLEEGKTWGIYANLYSVRSARNWGIGDFTDLKELIRLTGRLKGGFVGINPLHAIPNKKPYGISPYSPISRLYKNFIYLDMDSISDVADSKEAQKILDSEVFKKELQEEKHEAMIDYKKIAFLKKSILTYAFEHFYDRHYLKNTERGRAFKEYVIYEDAPLEAYALFQALWEHMNTRLKVYIWQDWPAEYHNPQSSAVQKFRDDNERDILFYKYIQWLVDVQHRESAELAAELDLPVGIYHDLAIGSIGGGSNGWSYQNLVAGAINVGAPPDEFNINGQNWNFPPVVPERLRETGYEFFTDIIRKNIKYNGALRIDHALGMFRLFWIPSGMPAVEGAYVTYPVEDLLRIIALESVRYKTMIIAEDLGTVGENVHATLHRFRMLSYRLLYFERNYPDPSFTLPEHYPDIALCAVTTHDLPTLYGYWAERDLEVKKQLNLFRDDEQWQRYVRDRERDRGLLLNALKSRGIVSDDFPANPEMISAMTDELCLAIYHYLAHTPCKLVAVSLDDIIGTVDQQNMPGTTDEYPNWMQKTPLSLEQILSDKRFEALAEMFRNARRSLYQNVTSL